MSARIRKPARAGKPNLLIMPALYRKSAKAKVER